MSTDNNKIKENLSGKDYIHLAQGDPGMASRMQYLDTEADRICQILFDLTTRESNGNGALINYTICKLFLFGTTFVVEECPDVFLRNTLKKIVTDTAGAVTKKMAKI